MKQKAGKTKETAREKKLRRKEFQDAQKQIKTIVIPTLIVVFLFIVAYVYLKTRPIYEN